MSFVCRSQSLLIISVVCHRSLWSVQCHYCYRAWASHPQWLARKCVCRAGSGLLSRLRDYYDDNQISAVDGKTSDTVRTATSGKHGTITRSLIGTFSDTPLWFWKLFPYRGLLSGNSVL